jgi:hypothetical protein
MFIRAAEPESRGVPGRRKILWAPSGVRQHVPRPPSGDDRTVSLRLRINESTTLGKFCDQGRDDFVRGYSAFAGKG